MLFVKNVLGAAAPMIVAAESSRPRTYGKATARDTYVGAVTPKVAIGIF